MIRVLVTDDSATACGHLVEILRSDPEIQVVGEARDGVEAVAMTRRLRPDLVTMDMRMPRMDGFEATRQIMTATPTPIVIVTASTSGRDVACSMRALQAGALTLLHKPPGPKSVGFVDAARQLIATIKAMAQVKVVRQHRSDLRGARPLPTGRERRGVAGRIVAIAASTGGPAALAQLLSGLPDDFAAPILVVQHISQGFTGGLADWLGNTSPLGVKLAEHGEEIAAHTMYLGPEDRHLGVSVSGRVVLSDDPPIGGFRPSATFLFDSVARMLGESTVAVMLTGMGSDGVEGLRTARAAGGYIIAQDESTSVVFGMPGTAITAGLPDIVLPLDAIAPRLRSLCGTNGVWRDRPVRLNYDKRQSARVLTRWCESSALPHRRDEAESRERLNTTMDR